MKLNNCEVGHKYKITEKLNPYTKQHHIQEIVVLSKARNNTFYFYNTHTNKVFHSNIFVWGVESIYLLEVPNLQQKELNGQVWLDTGIEEVDSEMANLGVQYKVFCELAPKKLLKKYERQENKNYHQENGKMVMAFLNFVIKGGKPNLFK